MLNFITQVAQAVLTQIILIFGLFFVLGWLLSRLQAAILRNYSRSVGWRGLLWTAWLGTPVHEYGHAFFAFIFRHKIEEVVLFNPDPNTGEFGHVNHSYNRDSLYQSVGNFFIGLAPLIVGPLLLVGLLYLLIPNGREMFAQLAAQPSSSFSLSSGIGDFLVSLFSWANLSRPSFWLFLYLSFCIASHSAPSGSDFKNAWQGWLVIIFWLFFFNILARLAGWDMTGRIAYLSGFWAELVVIYIYAFIISLIHWLASYLLLWPWRRHNV